jgi:hypothetical protein
MMAEALQQTGTIGPYKVMRQFTDALGAKFQAHHILEVQMFRRFGLGNPDLGPSVILSAAEHQAITAKLSAKDARDPQGARGLSGCRGDLVRVAARPGRGCRGVAHAAKRSPSGPCPRGVHIRHGQERFRLPRLNSRINSRILP